MPVASQHGSVLLIEEVSGTRGRKVTLLGPGLPFQGAGWETGLRAPTDWYPGNGVEATQQVIGPFEMPSSWEGVWRRNMLAKTPSLLTATAGGQDTPVTIPFALKTFLDTLFLSGARLRVSWINQKAEQDIFGNVGQPKSYKIVREGRATKWGFNPDRADDIKWHVEWTWVSRGQAQLQKTVSTRDEDSTALSTQLTAGINDATNLTQPLTLAGLLSIAQAPLALMTNLNRKLLQAESRISQVADAALEVASTPAQIANSALDIATNTMSVCRQFQQQFGWIPLEYQSTSDYANDLATQGKAGAAVYESTRTLARNAQQSRVRAQSILSTNPGGGGATSQQTIATGAIRIIAVYRTKQGDTPQNIAARFYGSADRALDLLRANHMPWGQTGFDVGTVLLVPKIGTPLQSV